jgi:hypothetical protein
MLRRQPSTLHPLPPPSGPLTPLVHTGFLLSGFLAACYLRPAVYDKTLGALAAKSPAWARWPFYELILAFVWSMF